MAMKVEDEFNGLLLHYSLDLILDVANFGMLLGLFQMPATVEVKAIEIAAVVAEADAIDIDHGEDVEVVLGEQELVLLCCCQQFVNDVLHDEGRRSFPGVLSGQNDDCLLTLILGLAVDLEKGDYLFGWGCAKILNPHLTDI